MSAGLRWTDNHCHLSPGADGDAQVTAAGEAGVTRLIDVGTDEQRSRQCIASAARHPGVVWATVGVHPHDATEGVSGLPELFAAPGVVAVGECGLDYHYDHSPRQTQRSVFAAQVGMAHDHDLPLVIHTREAWEETFAILDSEGVPPRTIFHCFTGGPAEAEEGLARGAYLSFSGIVTFKSAPELREAAALCPLDKMLVETDAPYLAPVPHRGKKNVPAFLPFVGSVLAETTGRPVGEVASATWDNAERVYALPVPGSSDAPSSGPAT